MMKKLFFFFSILLLAIPCHADIITVDDDGPSDYPSIEQGIEAAVDGDTVLVADGIYTGWNNKHLTWDANVKHIIVKSENGPDNCIIDCQNNSAAFHFDNTHQNSSDVIDGFTIKNEKSERCWCNPVRLFFSYHK